jgi:hypothetical protein
MSKEILIVCPVCQNKKKIDIPGNVISQSKGLSSISIPRNLVCEHFFQAYVDKNFTVRGYQKIDFELPKNIDQVKIGVDILSESILSDAETIKWNISPENLSYIFRGIIFNEPISFIVPDSKESLRRPIEDFLKFIFQETFKPNITILTEKTYKNLKKDFKNKTVIGWNKIISDKRRIMNINKMEVETKIINKFFREISKQEAIINLEYEIRKLFLISDRIMALAMDLEEDSEIDIISLADLLKERFSLDLEIQYLEYVIDVIRYYFKIIVPIQEIDRVSKLLSVF